MNYGQNEFLAAAGRQRAELAETVRQMDLLGREHKDRRAAVEAERGQAMTELTQALLPELTAPAVARAVALTGATALVHDDPVAAIARERVALESRRVALESDPRFIERELLRAPRVGTLVRHVAELEEFRAPLVELLESAAHPRLDRLLETGYGTDAYTIGWWRLSYYGDWKAADEILSVFPGKNFAELRTDIEEARRSITVYDEQLAALRAEIATGAALEEEHGQVTADLATLPERVLAGARTRLAQHLAGLELSDLGHRLDSEPDLVLAWKRVSGLRAKLEYLDQIVEEQLNKPRAALKQEIAKLDRELTKWSRPKYAGARYPEDQFRKRFVDRQGRSRRYVDRYRTTYETVYVFDRYDRSSLVSDILWWDLMTDGRIDGHFLPEVAHWHHDHPGYSYAPDPWHSDRHDDAAAVAAASIADDQTSDLQHDVS